MEIWEGNAASLLTSAARCSMVMSSGPWPNRLRKGFCSSLQNKSTLTRWKKKNNFTTFWLLLLQKDVRNLICIPVLGDAIVLCSPGKQMCKHGFLGIPVTCKEFFEKQLKKSQSLAPVNTWKSRTTNPTMSGHTQFSKICISYPIWYLHRDVNDDFCSHIVTLFQFHWLGEFPAEVAGMCRNEFQRNPATQTKESLLLQSKLGQTALV